MSKTVKVRYCGPQDRVDIDLRGVDIDDPGYRVSVEAGEVIEVPHDLAHGTPGYGGLLEQTSNWELADTPKKATKTEPTGPNKESD